MENRFGIDAVSDDKVIRFPVIARPIPKPQPPDDTAYVFRCSCACTSFYIHSPSGMIECCNCGEWQERHTEQPTGEWVKRLPDVPAEITETDAGSISVKTGDLKDFGVMKALRTLNGWADTSEMAMFAGWKRDGSAKYWTDIETQEQKDWCLRHLADFHEFVTLKKVTV